MIYNFNPVYVFGAGVYGKNLLRVLDSLNVKVRGFFDNGAKEKQQVAGYEVILPCKDVINAGMVLKEYCRTMADYKKPIKEEVFGLKTFLNSISQTN